MEALHEGENVFQAVGEFFALGGETARFVLDGFGPHVTFGDGDVAEEIAKGEFSRSVGPVDLVGRNTAGDAEGAFTDVAEVVEERLDGGDFHNGLHHIGDPHVSGIELNLHTNNLHGSAQGVDVLAGSRRIAIRMSSKVASRTKIPVTTTQN